MSDEKAPKPKIVLGDAGEKPVEPAPTAPASGPAVSVAPSEPAASEAPAPAGGRAPASFNVFEWVRRSFPGNENAVWGGVCGFIVALVFFAIGLWRTLVILVLVLVGVMIGQLRDGKTAVADTIRHFFSSNR